MQFWDTVLEITKLTPHGMLVVFILLLYKGRIRWSRDFEAKEREVNDLRQERDRWMRAALKGTEIVKLVVGGIDKANISKEESDEPTNT